MAGPAIISAEALGRFIAEIFTRVGMPDAHASTVADVLVWANLRGVDSHGVARVPRYVDMIQGGVMNPNPAITVRTETSAAVVLDTDRAAGPVAMRAAMAAAVGKAREAGIGLGIARATTHTGALGYYTQSAAHEGMAALALAASWPNMAYHGARAAGVSTSPISIAVPAGARPPVVFDMGTGVVSVGTLMQARRAGQPIPAGSALDQHGLPTTDPARAEIPLPIAGPKGSGLALMIELITSLVVANPILADALDGGGEGRRHRQNGLAIAIDLARFGDPQMYAREVERLVTALRALPRDPDAAEILIPGERGDRVFRQRSRDGIPVPPATCAELGLVADRLGVTMFS
ncbi:MAG: Ldh family oxidoreductase [Candidatus Rokubacteria bacterium]|nr:Ldh family oxidoreductase [Candidatus Rokubacteria bacterium]